MSDLLNRFVRILKSHTGSFQENEPSINRESEPPPSWKTSARSTHSSNNAPPSNQLHDYYANLELDYGAPFSDIKKAYRRLLKHYHPDQYQHDPEKRATAEQITRRLNDVYAYFEKRENDPLQ